jgi:hypothetical protein
MNESKKPSWVLDTPEVRAYHGKTLKMFKGDIDQGIFTMEVVEKSDTGESKTGYVLVNAVPLNDLAKVHIPAPH